MEGHSLPLCLTLRWEDLYLGKGFVVLSIVFPWHLVAFYLRFDPKIGNNIELDDVSKIDEVISFAKSVKLFIIEDWLNKYWYS